MGSSNLFKRWWYRSDFLAAVMDYHFIRLIRVKFEVTSTGPLGDVVELNCCDEHACVSICQRA